jgi:L-iditol 2-dehydrogenase
MGHLNAAAARAYGAGLVVVAGMTPSRLELAGRICADRVIDVRSQDLCQQVRALTSGRGADVVLVAVSSASAAESGLGALRRGGRLNMFAGTSEGTSIPLDLRRLHYDEWTLTGSFGAAPSHLRRALNLIVSGQVDVSPLITGRYPFDQALDAIEHMASLAGMKAVVVFE